MHSATQPENFLSVIWRASKGLGLKFLLVFLFDTMVHIAEHRDETSEDFPWRKRSHLLRHRALATRRLVLEPCAPHGGTRQCRRPELRQGMPPPERSLRPESSCANYQAPRPRQGL